MPASPSLPKKGSERHQRGPAAGRLPCGACIITAIEPKPAAAPSIRPTRCRNFEGRESRRIPSAWLPGWLKAIGRTAHDRPSSAS